MNYGVICLFSVGVFLYVHFITGTFGCVRANFTLRRHYGYYMTQVYVPSILIVMLSWISFWLAPDAVPARISLGILTILAMTNQLSAVASASLPEVGSWWRHQMEAFSASLAICAGNSPVTGEFLAQRPVTRSFGVFFDLLLIKRLSKQS